VSAQLRADVDRFGHLTLLHEGWSIDRLADESGVGRHTIINLEGAIKTPRIDTLFAVAVALDVPLGDLVDVL